MQNRKLRVIDTNAAILSVIHILYSREKQVRHEVNSAGNIFSIFFHDLAIHFSGILMQRETVASDTGEALFPYVGQNYAVSPRLINLDFSKQTNTHYSIKSVLRGLRILPFAVGNSLPFGYKQDYLLSKSVNLLGEYQEPAKAFVHRLDWQVQSLSDCIGDICMQHLIPNPDVIRRIWVEYVAFHCTEQLAKVSSKKLLLGNRQDLQNRKLAHNFLEQEKEVIAFTHGEIASTVFDEPMYRYAERGLCTTLVEYGNSTGFIESEDVMMPPKRTLYRSSKVAISKYRRSSNIVARELEGLRVLYIPTTYVGNQIYGPFHAYPDSVYAEWHSAIARTLRSVVFKAHPKSQGRVVLPGRQDKRWLDDCIEEYDVLILDYVATSTVLAMLTKKPVIFFDIGLRRLAANFVETLKERSHYVQIDINGYLDDQIQEGIASFSSSGCCWSNLNVGKYCLAGDRSFSWSEIFMV